MLLESFSSIAASVYGEFISVKAILLGNDSNNQFAVDSLFEHLECSECNGVIVVSCVY